MPRLFLLTAACVLATVLAVASGSMARPATAAAPGEGPTAATPVAASPVAVCAAGKVVFDVNAVAALQFAWCPSTPCPVQGNALTLPVGCDRILMKMWGAGGGSAIPTEPLSGDGGGGGYIEEERPRGDITTLYAVVGKTELDGKGPGDYSAIALYPTPSRNVEVVPPRVLANNYWMVAGGGGGGGAGDTEDCCAVRGGNGGGGGQAGQAIDTEGCAACFSGWADPGGGGGGGFNDWGTGGSGSNSGQCPDGDHDGLIGGAGGGCNPGAPGWYGGGAGGQAHPSYTAGAGGGGTGPEALGFVIDPGQGRAPGNEDDPDRTIRAPGEAAQSWTRQVGLGCDARADPNNCVQLSNPLPNPDHRVLTHGRVVVYWYKGTDPGDEQSCTAPAPPPENFHAIDPCRVVDTRIPLGTLPLRDGLSRRVDVGGTCNVPVGAVAVALNLTAVNPPGSGHLSVRPGCRPPTSTSVLNFVSGVTRSNNAVAKLHPDGHLVVDAVLIPNGTLNFVLDVTGYFLP